MMVQYGAEWTLKEEVRMDLRTPMTTECVGTLGMTFELETFGLKCEEKECVSGGFKEIELTDMIVDTLTVSARLGDGVIGRIRLTVGAEAIPGDCSGWDALAAVDCTALLDEALPAESFKGCRALRSIVFSRRLRRIGSECFAGCSALVSCNSPSIEEGFLGRIVWIGNEAFAVTGLWKVVAGPELRGL
jgi:hypothetical protein